MKHLYTLLLALQCVFASAQEVVIESFDVAGQIVFEDVAHASQYRVEWASDPDGPWASSWETLEAIPATGRGSVTGKVPMLYRVVAFMTNDLPRGMVWVPGGSFAMGDAFEGDLGGADDELPVHDVELAPFLMDATEVTKSGWDEVAAWAGTNRYDLSEEDGSGKEDGHPVQLVTWYEAVKWCNARSEMERLSPCYFTDAGLSNVYREGEVALTTGAVDWEASGYRLPTEAEWEFAARGGASNRRFPWDDANTTSHTRANYDADGGEGYDQSDGAGYHPDHDAGAFPYTSPAAAFAANGYGLYDMAGNVQEWCWDRYGDDYYASSPGTHPRGPDTGADRVLRGGGWFFQAHACRVAFRHPYAPEGSGLDRGFRTARKAP